MIVCDEGTPQGAYTANLEWVENEGVSKSTLVSSSLSRSVHQGEYCKKGGTTCAGDVRKDKQWAGDDNILTLYTIV